MVSLQYGFRIAASQTLVAVTLAEFFELLDGKVPTTGMLRSSPLAMIVGLGLPDFFGVTLGPFLAASYNFIAVAFVVLASRNAHPIFVFCCPSFLVLGDLFLVFLVVLSACFDPMGQVRPGSLKLGVLL
jgi:hypothetical protein